MNLPACSYIQILAGMGDESARGMAALYTHVLQLDRNIRMPFLRAVLRSFDTAADLLTTGAATANLRQACSKRVVLKSHLRVYCVSMTRKCYG